MSEGERSAASAEETQVTRDAALLILTVLFKPLLNAPADDKTYPLLGVRKSKSEAVAPEGFAPDDPPPEPEAIDPVH